MSSVPYYGIMSALGMLGYKYFQGQLDEAGVDDRAYRISKNQDQSRLDQISTIGMLSGGVLGALIYRLGPGTIAATAATGVVFSVSYFQLEKTGSTKKIKELIDSLTETK